MDHSHPSHTRPRPTSVISGKYLYLLKAFFAKSGVVSLRSFRVKKGYRCEVLLLAQRRNTDRSTGRPLCLTISTRD